MRHYGALCLLLFLAACQTLDSGSLPTLASLPGEMPTVVFALPSTLVPPVDAALTEPQVSIEEAAVAMLPTETFTATPETASIVTSTAILIKETATSTTRPTEETATPIPQPENKTASQTPQPNVTLTNGVTMTSQPSVIVIPSNASSPLGASPTFTPSKTYTPTASPTIAASKTHTPTASPTITASKTHTPTASPTITASKTYTPTVSASKTFTPIPQDTCSWQWATQERPELTQQIQTEMGSAGLTQITVRAYAYGENCVGSISRKVLYFAQMQIDFDLTVQVEDAFDQAALTSDLVTMFNILKNHADGNRGRVLVASISSSGNNQIYLQLNDLMSYIAQHPDGAGLLALVGITTP